MQVDRTFHMYGSVTHQRNVVFVLIVTLSNWITGLAVRSTHESFGSPSQETSPAEGQPSRGEGEVDLNHSAQYTPLLDLINCLYEDRESICFFWLFWYICRFLYNRNIGQSIKVTLIHISHTSFMVPRGWNLMIFVIPSFYIIRSNFYLDTCKTNALQCGHSGSDGSLCKLVLP